jgi:hypothetical protein
MLLKLRTEARYFLKFDVGNYDSNIFLCSDWWHPEGVLYDRFGYRIIYDANNRVNAKFSSVIRGGSWPVLGPARFDDLVLIQSKLFYGGAR